MDNDLRKLFEEFLKECQFSTRLSTDTIRGYSSVFGLFITVMPEVRDTSNLTPQMITEFFHRLHTRERVIGKSKVNIGVKDSTIRTYWNKLNAFFKWLLKKSLLINNPFGDMRPPEITYEDGKALSNLEVRTLYSAITLRTNNSLTLRRDTLMVSLLLFCGLRFNEFISLELRDIDFERQLITIRGITSKSRRIRLIPIHPTLMFHLKDYIKERNKCGYRTPYLIVSTQGDSALTIDGLKHWVKRLCIKSGVKFHVHRFRHTFASNLAHKNVNAVKIQKLLGHRSLNMTMTYLRSINSEDLHDDISKLSI